LRLAGTSKKAHCSSLVFSRTMKDDLIDACSDVRASIADNWLLSTSVLVSDGTELKQTQKSKPNLSLH